MYQCHSGISEREKNADLHVKIQMQIEICNFTLIFAIEVISAILNNFLNRDFSCKYPGDSYESIKNAFVCAQCWLHSTHWCGSYRNQKPKVKICSLKSIFNKNWWKFKNDRFLPAPCSPCIIFFDRFEVKTALHKTTLDFYFEFNMR